MSLTEVEENYEHEIENGHYRQYVEKYPLRLTEIFSNFYLLSRIKNEDIRFFLDKGLDINQPSCHYMSDAHFSSPMHSACEFRRIDLFPLLVTNGADPNLVLRLPDFNGEPIEYTPLESYLVGHGYLDLFEERSRIERGINLLVSLGARPEIRPQILWRLRGHASVSEEDSIGSWIHQVVSVLPENFRIP